MKLEKRGKGEPEITVVGSIHGDEPCGKKAIERILSEDTEFERPVQFLIGNEKALEKGVRYTDTDLNRAFPGDPESEKYEERLAAEILDVVKGTKLLDLHSTQSYPEPFANFSDTSTERLELVEATGVQYAVHFPGSAGSLNEKVKGVVVECGYQGTEDAVENAYSVTKNFLSCLDAIRGECMSSDPEVFRHLEQVEGSGYEFTAENFQLIRKGEVFARKNGEERKAEEDFYPVLMSTNGYEDIIGNRAEKLGRLSELK